MDKGVLLNEVQTVMMMLASRNLDAGEKERMAGAVRQFVRDEAARLSIAQILDHLITPVDALEWFQTYFCENFRDQCCLNEFPEEMRICVWN